jgi:hypothetical protein
MLGIGVALLAISQLPSPSAKTYAAFTSEYTVCSKAGASSRQKNMYWAVRADGATSSGSLDEPNHVRQLKFSGRRTMITVSDISKLKTTRDASYIPLPPFQSLPRQRGDCKPNTPRVATLLGEEMMLGFRTYHYKLGLTTVQDATTREDHVWYVPDLNCYEMQSKTYRRAADGTLTGEFEKSTTRIAVGEPQQELFAVPTDYQEVKPSELGRAVIFKDVEAREGAEKATRYHIPEAVIQSYASEDATYEMIRNRQLPPPRK